MKVYEVMDLCREILELLQKSCIKVDDVRYLDMYADYRRMVNDGGMKTYIVATLVEAYHVSERQVYYVIDKFSRDCNTDAV